jgi:hypothetical protein
MGLYSLQRYKNVLIERKEVQELTLDSNTSDIVWIESFKIISLIIISEEIAITEIAFFLIHYWIELNYIPAKNQ